MNALASNHVVILSSFKGCLWAGIILKHWGCTIYYSLTHIHSSVDLIITDSETEIQGQELTKKIILKQSNIFPVHLLAMSGLLSTFGQSSSPFHPTNLVQLLVANSLAIHVLYRLLSPQSRDNSKQVQQIEIIELIKYFGAFFISANHHGMLSFEKGNNILDGGAPYYSIYPCKSGLLAIGNLEPKFYQEMIKGLTLNQKETEFMENAQFDRASWTNLRILIQQKMKEKTAAEWELHFQKYDTCITEIKLPFYLPNFIHPQLTPLPNL